MIFDLWVFVSCMLMVLLLICSFVVGIYIRSRAREGRRPKQNQVLDLSHLENNDFLRVERIINNQFGVEHRENYYETEDLDTARETLNDDILENINIV